MSRYLPLASMSVVVDMFDHETEDAMEGQTTSVTYPLQAERGTTEIALTPAGTRERIQRAGNDLWRVISPAGRVIGHLESVDDPRGVRFRAKRYHAPTMRFRELGEFWAAEDAIACLRYAG
ncbi:MAG TPA: hypothetical protein VFY91_10090 [Microbacterium sp.]|nr:hypothetical protein [Microbacterium sp.]